MKMNEFEREFRKINSIYVASVPLNHEMLILAKFIIISPFTSVQSFHLAVISVTLLATYVMLLVISIMLQVTSVMLLVISVMVLVISVMLLVTSVMLLVI